MRQVPHYLIIGNGYVARHFRYYFSLLNLSFDTWSRANSKKELTQKLNFASHVLILISDPAIESFATTFLKQTNAVCIHFSGSVFTPHAYGAHPLLCFNKDLYDLSVYSAITFVVDQGAPETLLPGVPNKIVHLDPALKTKYHAFCVLSGNFSCLLWQKLFTSLEEIFKIPKEIAFIYLQQQTKNLLSDSKNALTGPLVRQDMQTIYKHLTVLENDPFQKVYESFVSCYQKMIEEG